MPPGNKKTIQLAASGSVHPWKAKNAFHLSKPPPAAMGHIVYLSRYTNKSLVQDTGQATYTSA
jgi:hypothetical protein